MPAPQPSPQIKARRTRALWSLSAGERYLDQRRSEVLAMIEDGRIAWAFDLAAPSARRRELRILAASVLEAAGKPNGLLKPTANFSLEEIAGIILPHRRPALRGTELQRAFGISHQAISTLARRRALKASARAQASDVPNGSLKFSRESVLNFLRRSICV